MAQRIEVALVDDLDGSDAGETVKFGLDGVSYEIDLSDKNAELLRDALAEYVGHARRTGGRVKRRKGKGGKAEVAAESSAVREWAAKMGIELAGRGRIPKDVWEQYRRRKEEPKRKQPRRKG